MKFGRNKQHSVSGIESTYYRGMFMDSTIDGVMHTLDARGDGIDTYTDEAVSNVESAASVGCIAAQVIIKTGE